MRERTTILLLACMLALLLLMSSCGSDDGPLYLYSVDVINGTDSMITVRYDWDSFPLIPQWLGEDTIAVGANKIIEWYSQNQGSEWIEVEYQGKRRSYLAGQMGTVQVTMRDFP